MSRVFDAILLRRSSDQVIPGLDGLRAISILMVILAHLYWMPSFPFKVLARVVNPGVLGVRIFFVISGFLITGMLLDEKNRSCTVSLKDFYLRRTFRIFPAYYVFLACAFGLAAFGVIKLDPSDYLYTLTYTFNLKGNETTWWVGHTWSLGIEEQFYLLWPLVVRQLRVQAIQRIAIFWFLISPIGRVLMNEAPHSLAVHARGAFPFSGAEIAIGALLAVWWRQDRLREYVVGVTRRWWFGLIPIAVLAVEGLAHRPKLFPHPVVWDSMLIPIADIGIALVVAWAATGTKGLVSRFLNSAPMVAVGVLSYSLYLWQMLLIHPYAAPSLLAFPLNLIWLAIIALLSFELIERPLNQYGHRLRKMKGTSLVTETVRVTG